MKHTTKQITDYRGPTTSVN